MSGELPPQVQNQLAQLQQLQQQAQAVMTQKNQIEVLIRETEAALKELEKSSDDAVIYKSVGELLFRADRSKLMEELKERKEMHYDILVLSEMHHLPEGQEVAGGKWRYL